MQSNNPSPQSSYSDNKSTRKYVKTGKYSKKKQQQTQQQLQVAIQQQIQAALQQNPQSLAAQQLLQQAVAMANLHNNNSNNNNNNESLGTNIPPFSSQQLTNISTSMLPITSQQQLSAANSPSASTTPTTTMASSPSTPFNTTTNVYPAQSINSTTTNTLETQLINMPLPISVSGTSNNNGITQENATAPPMTITGGLSSSTINSHLNKLVRNNGSSINKNVEGQHIEIIKRCTESLQKDHERITKPDYLTPFKSLEDAMDRLLPYHIYQYPSNDLDANKIPMDRQDHTMLDIYKSQVDIFKRYNKVTKKKLKSKKNLENQIMLERQVMTSIRQRVNEEQMRVQMEQKAQQQALRLQAEAEKARLLQQQQLHQQQLQQQQLHQQQLQQQQLHQQQLQQQQQQLQHQQFLQGQQTNTNPALQNFPYAYAQTLHALMQNKEFAEQYQKLTPELQQQFLRNLNHEKVAEFLKRKNNMSTG
ncbi:unnamed protein product [Cunninghamella echinulata]